LKKQIVNNRSKKDQQKNRWIIEILKKIKQNTKKQDFKIHSIDTLQFDPDIQYAVIRSSICTGEKVAGFKNKKDGHFTEVMLIRSKEDEKYFKEHFHLESVKVEY